MQEAVLVTHVESVKLNTLLLLYQEMEAIPKSVKLKWQPNANTELIEKERERERERQRETEREREKHIR